MTGGIDEPRKYNVIDTQSAKLNFGDENGLNNEER